MGNVNGLVRAAQSELNRVAGQSHPKSFDGVTLDQIAQIQLDKIVRDCPVDIMTVPALFSIDREHKGYVTCSDVEEFVKSCVEVERRLRQARQQEGVDIAARIRALMMLELRHQLLSTTGQEEFMQWLFLLLLRPGEYCVRYEMAYIPQSTVYLLHSLLGIKSAFGHSNQDFFHLLQLAAEETGILPLEDESLDEYVPLTTLLPFLSSYMMGAVSILEKLGPVASTSGSGPGRGPDRTKRRSTAISLHSNHRLLQAASRALEICSSLNENED